MENFVARSVIITQVNVVDYRQATFSCCALINATDNKQISLLCQSMKMNSGVAGFGGGGVVVVVAITMAARDRN